ncbi:hypothetical protein ACFFWD_09635 [Bradyrhizobium erythrophlei]|uniref:hypothetical protein n=1 Tax=Bradyrhizobium erythrophlei TaxID=1437360 RepID=UPI0035EBB51F
MLNLGNTAGQKSAIESITDFESRSRRIVVRSCFAMGRQKHSWGTASMQQRPSGALSADSSGYVFYFQLASNGARRACSLTIKAESAIEATRIFRENWTTIESMARDGVSAGMISSTPVCLALS